jgi:hypothetical protein
LIQLQGRGAVKRRRAFIIAGALRSFFSFSAKREKRREKRPLAPRPAFDLIQRFCYNSASF